jgi:hypothetical protein
MEHQGQSNFIAISVPSRKFKLAAEFKIDISKHIMSKYIDMGNN